MVYIDEKIYLWLINIVFVLLLIFVASQWRKRKMQRPGRGRRPQSAGSRRGGCS